MACGKVCVNESCFESSHKCHIYTSLSNHTTQWLLRFRKLRLSPLRVLPSFLDCSAAIPTAMPFFCALKTRKNTPSSPTLGTWSRLPATYMSVCWTLAKCGCIVYWTKMVRILKRKFYEYLPGHTTALGDDDVQGNQQQQTGFVKASALLRNYNSQSSVVQESSQTLPTPMVETPPSSQPYKLTASGQALSRQSTESVVDIPSPSSSSWPLSSSSSFSSTTTTTTSLSSRSLSSFSEGSGESGDQKLRRILCAVQKISDECRICWLHRETTRPHLTFRCPKRICSSNDWNRFKIGLRFPKDTVCYFCLAPYAAPFNHARPSLGTRPSPDDCEYPDVLKELAYILYQDDPLRRKIFSKLGISEPLTLQLYQRFIGKRQQDGILGAYEVVNAYLEMRESGELET